MVGHWLLVVSTVVGTGGNPFFLWRSESFSAQCKPAFFHGFLTPFWFCFFVFWVFFIIYFHNIYIIYKFSHYIHYRQYMHTKYNTCIQSVVYHLLFIDIIFNIPITMPLAFTLYIGPPFWFWVCFSSVFAILGNLGSQILINYFLMEENSCF